MVTTPLRECILHHVSRYGLTLRPVLDRLFYSNSERGCERDLAELRKEGLLAVAENAVRDPKDTKTAYSYYYLTRAATSYLGVSDARARQPGPEAVARNLAILWYCCMRETRSHRLESKEVFEVLHGAAGQDQKPSGATLPKGYHCLSRIDDYRLLNVYTPKTTVTEIMSELRKRLAEARAIPAVDVAIKSRHFGFLVLVESRSLQEQVWEKTREIAKSRKAKFIVLKSPGKWKG